MDQCVQAEVAGANRLELCGPGDGGLTPSREVLLETLQKVNIPTHVMIRPRAGDFNYSDAEFEQMLASIAEVKASSATGVVFGVLRPDNTLDLDRMKRLVEASKPLTVVCHKAFDETLKALDTID